MGEIKILKGQDVVLDSNSAFSSFAVLPDNCPDIEINKCRLKAGSTYEPCVYGKDDKVQMFFIIKPSGYIRSGKTIYYLDDQGVFVPNFNQEKVELRAGESDLEYLNIKGPMIDVDKRQMENCQYVLPRFVRLRDSIKYTERFTQESGSKVISHSIIAGRHLGRYTMGWNIGAGPDFIGQHTHPTLEQWYFMIDGSDFTYKAGGKGIPVVSGDITFTPHGTSHGSECTKDGFINYVWFELNRAWEEI